MIIKWNDTNAHVICNKISQSKHVIYFSENRIMMILLNFFRHFKIHILSILYNLSSNATIFLRYEL